jgi:CO dehydrogenase maturation factor
MKIAVSGKGGVGKTTLSALLITVLASMGRRVLAIDADSSPHLARVLGFPNPDEITPIAEMRELLNERSERDGPFYRLNPRVDDLPERFIRIQGNIKLMTVGAIRQGGGGCACSDNVVLKALLNTLMLSPNEDIVLDMEAGVEHLGRGTVASVDHLLVVAQPYLGSIETVSKIIALAKDLKMKAIHVVVNAVSAPEDVVFVEKSLNMPVLAAFPASSLVRQAERTGAEVALADETMLQKARELLEKLGAFSA